MNPPSIDPISSTRHAVLSVQLRSVAERTDTCDVRHSECVGLDVSKLAQHRTVSVCWCEAAEADTTLINVQCCGSSVAIKMCCVTMLPTAQLIQRRYPTKQHCWTTTYPSGSLLAVSLTRTELESKLCLRGYRRAATASQQGRCTLQS